MSSIVECVAAYLHQCPYMDNTRQVNIDRYDPSCGYSVSPVGQTVATRYMDGSQVIESDFVLYLTDAANDDGERIENSAFLERVFAWIEEQSRRRNLPDLGTGRTARRLTAANGMLFETMQDGTAVYQLQIKLTYFQKGER